MAKSMMLTATGRYHVIVGRLIFNLAALSSLLLVIAASILWIRSATNEEGWRQSDWSFRVANRVVGLYVACDIDLVDPADAGRHWIYWKGPRPGLDNLEATLDSENSLHDRSDISVRIVGLNFRSLARRKENMSGPPFPMVHGAGWHLTVPHWMVVLAALILPGCWLIGRFRSRAKGGCCSKCGYDLRGNVDAKRCPECGADAPVKSERASVAS